MAEKNIVKGGGFLIEEIAPESVFTPEEFTEEQLMIAKTAEDFVTGKVVPRIDELEVQKEGLMRELLVKCAELGLLAVEIPEEHGGLGLDKITSLLVSEKMGRGASFLIAHQVHTGIGTLPLILFGTPEQKKKYLPALASGEKIGAYALTEPGAGTDALAIKTKAVLTPDGKHYILNGTKQFISNAAYADVIITYAKIDGEKFTAFIIEREMPGVSLGVEEKKLGIKGSSTRNVIMEDVKIPVENILGEAGKGHVIAFNTLNIGRYKLGGGCAGAAKIALEESVKYAKERKQFGKPICAFGMISQKIAEMTVKIYVAESMGYRTAGLLDDIIKTVDHSSPDAGRQMAKCIEEYDVECSINKVFGSEVLAYVVDEAVAIFGGYGYIQEYQVERGYRDARINRIFEGTNEINRLLIPGRLLRKAMKGELALIPAAQKIVKELITLRPSLEVDQTALGVQKKMVEMAKKAALLVTGAAAQKYMDKLADEQEILQKAADIIIEIFAMESALLRALKTIAQQGEDKSGMHIDIVKTYINDAMGRIDLLAKEALPAIAEGDMLKTQLAGLKKFMRYAPINTIELRRRIAKKIIEAEKYKL